MRKYALPLFVVLSLGASSVAMAADTTATGAIKSLDAKACTVTLADAKVYQFAAKCDFTKLTVGEKVTITYTTKGTTEEASMIAAAK